VECIKLEIITPNSYTPVERFVFRTEFQESSYAQVQDMRDGS
jgi:hypothetical protein